MDPIEASILINRPREAVYDYLADVSNHQEFTDHYLKDWRLLRVDPVGVGAGARYRIDAPFDRFGWADFTIIEAQRPFKLVAAGRGGKFNRNKTWTTWELSPTSGGTLVELTTETEPALATDRVFEGLTRRRGWTRRRVNRSLSRLQSILEENHDRGRRATVAGV